MISELNTQITKFRAFGWVQDPSDLRSLCNVVAIFDPNSEIHNQLLKDVIPNLVENKDGKETLLKALKTTPLKIKYSALVGTGFIPKRDSRCNSIVQATVKGQKRDFISAWAADNFMRWAYAFGFVKYDYKDDTFEITDEGLELTKVKKTSIKISKDEKELLIKAILAYPPAVRILKLLSETETTHLTKFEIGRQLGFVGEDGFTSFPQGILLKSIAISNSKIEKNKLKTDCEGSADKYARMIAMWLQKLDLVSQEPKKFIGIISSGEKINIEEKINHAYKITLNGYKTLNRILGKSSHKQIFKNICWEMFATKGSDREYLRTRRSYILKILEEQSKKNSYIKIDKIIDYLFKKIEIKEEVSTIEDDIKGLINIGLNIIEDSNGYFLKDKIKDFVIPLSNKLIKSDLTDTKDILRTKLKKLSHEYLALIDLAYDGKQNKFFEIKILQLFIEECGFKGLHLGGIRKPDGIIYTDDLENNFGVIIDTKAYSKGYPLPISQADEMERYIEENQKRDKALNSNIWWTKFNSDLKNYYFMFISGDFVGDFKSKLERIHINKNINGVALSTFNLLICADEIKCKTMDHLAIENKMFINDEFKFIIVV